MPVSENFIKNLIETDDPLKTVWQEMAKIYTPKPSPHNLRDFFDEREVELNSLELTLYQSYFESYDLLLEKGLVQDTGLIRRLLTDTGIVIIADSLSIREAFLLQDIWSAKSGWEVQVEGFTFAPFPPITASLAKPLLETESPAQGRDRPDFTYRYVAGPERIPDMPKAKPLLIWMRLPDTALELVTAAQSQTIADAFDKTTRTLERLLEAANRKETYLTSDHGYLYARYPNQCWSMPSQLENTIRTIFKGECRWIPVLNEKSQLLKNLESHLREQRFFAFTDTHITIRGRYWWGSVGPNDRCTVHGGLSFAECLVPLLKLTSKR